jgi:hypothetical protein
MVIAEEAQNKLNEDETRKSSFSLQTMSKEV